MDGIAELGLGGSERARAQCPWMFAVVRLSPTSLTQNTRIVVSNTYIYTSQQDYMSRVLHIQNIIN